MAQGKKALGMKSRLLIVVVFIFFLCSIVSAGTVVIKPGQFDHFTLQMPERAIAGENFIIRVSVYDTNKNLITNFSETGKEFKVDVTGSSTVQPSVLGAASFSGGVANVLVNDKKAEKIIFSIREAGGSVPVISREISVVPNKLDHFALQSPVSVAAGAVFDVKIVAKDLFENTVQDLDVGKNLKITTTGTSSVKLSGTGTIDFKGGIASAGFVSEKTGDVIIDLQDITSGSRGRTQSIQVNPSVLSYFKMQSPAAAVAGDPFEILITAHDEFDNVVSNYAATGSGVRLVTSGSSKLEPSAVPASGFKGGQASIKVLYEKAEEIQISARETNREQSGKTAPISVTHASPDHFIVVTPDTALSGQNFKVRIEAYDRYNNIVKNFNLTGNDVLLSTSGTGSLSPAKILPPDFVNGVAVVDVMYDKAESFQISARMSSDRTQGRVSVSSKETGREVVHTPAKAERKPEAGKPPVATTKDLPGPDKQKKAEKVQPKPEAKKEPAAPVKPKAKAESVKEPAPKTAEPKKTEPKEQPKNDVVKKETPKKEIKEPEKKTAAEKLPEPKKEQPPVKPVEKKAEKPAVEDVRKPVELAKKEEKKTDKPLLYSVSKISIIEAKNKAMLVVNVTNPNGNLVFGDEIESKFGKEWLKLRIRPAVNSTEKNFKFKSAYVGEVLVEEDKTGGQNFVNLYIELIPSGVTYDIARVKNTLVITLSNP